MLKRNSSVILLLSSLFVLASCGGGGQSATGLSTSEESKATGLSSSESSKATGLSSSEESKATGLSSSESSPDQDDPLANSPMKVSKKNGEIIITSGVEKNPSKETEYQWLNVNLTGSTANVELKFTFTPEGGEPVVYGADKVKTACAALVEATENGFFKVKEADKYDFYIETGSTDNGIWVEKHKEPVVPTETATWYIAGEGSLWPNADGWATGMLGMTDEAGDKAAAKLNVTFAVGDKFKVVDPANNTWLGSGALGEAYAEFGDDETSNHNIAVKTAGTYNVYVNSENIVFIVAANAE